MCVAVVVFVIVFIQSYYSRVDLIIISAYHSDILYNSLVDF